jgi:hypothetical protein
MAERPPVSFLDPPHPRLTKRLFLAALPADQEGGVYLALAREDD